MRGYGGNGKVIGRIRLVEIGEEESKHLLGIMLRLIVKKLILIPAMKDLYVKNKKGCIEPP